MCGPFVRDDIPEMTNENGDGLKKKKRKVRSHVSEKKAAVSIFPLLALRHSQKSVKLRIYG